MINLTDELTAEKFKYMQVSSVDGLLLNLLTFYFFDESNVMIFKRRNIQR